MSEFVRLLNLIKTRRDSTWLTPSQKAALETLLHLLQVPGSVNLAGAAGVGKTFLSWALAQELDYRYLPHVSYLAQAENLAGDGIIIDNCDPGRQAHRQLVGDLAFREVRHAVFVTRELTRDYTYFVELRLTRADQAHVWRNLIEVGAFREFTEAANLWYLLNPSL